MPTEILVIEDAAQIRENLVELLQLSGYNVQTAPDGINGLHKAREVKPDLILCDIMMPDMDGHQVLTTIRNYPDLAHVPFIFLTAKADMVDLRQGMGLGADDYLTKPFLSSDLLTAIASRLKRCQQQRVSRPPKSGYLTSLSGHDAKGNIMLTVPDCLYFYVQLRSTYVWHKAGLFQLNKTLDMLTAALDPHEFFRVNRHVILHRKTIQQYAYWEKGKYCLYLTINGQQHQVILPKARYSAFRNWLST
ncbi:MULTISPECIES: response regulator [Spirosoma]|uniref:DNA-binding response regulator n=1 Tax=Spirosoma sordidisoli TaxID=2502893 RepID=A0A4Q2UR34_9BACT|nr:MULTISPECIES: response regulator [Spirosoma]RYC70135.1 DNA-binding response regulator [Spirosoma sordidisoli]